MAAFVLTLEAAAISLGVEHRSVYTSARRTDVRAAECQLIAMGVDLVWSVLAAGELCEAEH